MDEVPGPAALTRALLTLARSGANGVLTVQASEGRGRFALREGRATALRLEPDAGDGLGEHLRRLRSWDEAAARRGPGRRRGEPVGRWWVRLGAAEPAAVSHALRVQMRRRARRVFDWPHVELRFRQGAPDIGVPELEEPPSTGGLVLGALRSLAERASALAIRRRLGDGILVATPMGRALLAEAPLFPDEAALVAALERGETVGALMSIVRGSPRALRTLYALSVVGGVGPPRPRAGYATLRRKAGQLRRAARAHELLEVSAGARGGQARRALRRMARAVHPDRFGPREPDGIRDASERVMSALVRASRTIERR